MLTKDEALEQRITDDGIHVIEDPQLPKHLGGIYYHHGQFKIICIQPHTTRARRLCVLAEEYGHAQTSIGDERKMRPTEIGRQEARALAWAIREIVPLPRLLEAFTSGARNNYEYAEYLGVTEEFFVQALRYYFGE